jgi:hypothetical protein
MLLYSCNTPPHTQTRLDGIEKLLKTLVQQSGAGGSSGADSGSSGGGAAAAASMFGVGKKVGMGAFAGATTQSSTEGAKQSILRA